MDFPLILLGEKLRTNSKTDFIQGGMLQWVHNRATTRGVCGSGERRSSTLNLKKRREFIPRSKVGVNGWKISMRKQGTQGRFWLNPPNRMHAEGRPGSSGVTWGPQRMKS